MLFVFFFLSEVMKKKLLLISSVLLTLSLVNIIFFNSMDNKENNIIKNVNKDNQILKENMITMMYETEAGSGNYELTQDTTWPESDYVFNSELSGCENGGELSWNSTNRTVNLLTNTPDRCFVYFDKYSGVWIDNVEISEITGNKITLNVNATSDNGTITTYYYSINNSQYMESSSNIIQITDLNKVTEYNIKVYAVDNTNTRSNIYTIDATTTADSGPSINFVLVSNVSENSITLNVSAVNPSTIKKYYYSINNNAYTESANSVFTFTGLNQNTTYNISIYIEDNQGQQSSIYSMQISTINKVLLADYIKGLYTSDGTNGLYYHDGSGTYGSMEAEDNSYRYAGANPNNYICFGAASGSCSSDNLYRIIGIFDDNSDGIYNLKLIKNTSIGNYVWCSSSSTCLWNSSSLNNTVLNQNFLYNTLDSSLLDFITSNLWKTKWNRGVSDDMRLYYYDAKNAYEYELGYYANPSINVAKIGLMYLSDYYYGASASCWSTAGQSYSSCRSVNWLDLGVDEWTITPDTFYISSNGNVYSSNYQDNYEYAARPTFYLNSNVEYSSGTGTQSDPYRIKI